MSFHKRIEIENNNTPEQHNSLCYIFGSASFCKKKDMYHEPSCLEIFTINGRKVSFFTENIVLEVINCRCNNCTHNDKQTIYATFFGNSEKFNRVVKFELLNKKGDINRYLDENGNLYKRGNVPLIGLYNDTKQTDVYDSEMDYISNEISQFMRKSNTLTKYKETDSNAIRVYTDKGGIGIFCANRYSNSGTHLILRSFICYGLIMVYKDILKSLSKEVADEMRMHKNRGNLDSENERSIAIETYNQLLMFLSTSYTNFPIKEDRHEMSNIWDICSKYCQLGKLKQEVETELGRLGEFIQSEKLTKQLTLQTEIFEVNRIEHQNAEYARQRDALFQKRSERRQKALNAVVTLLSLLIAAVSIPEAMQDNLIDMASSTGEYVSPYFDRLGDHFVDITHIDNGSSEE